jgi:Zn-dependent protease
VPSTTPGLKIFGFPLDIRPGFLVLLALFAFIYPDGIGPWLAGAVGLFTLIHELGHAFAARATGAKAKITLDFLAGYASFTPTRHLKRWERAGIAAAGPAIQIGLGVVVLVAMGVNPLELQSVNDRASTLAIWFAGPIIGLINLLPILPLDGGNIVLTGLEVVIPGRSRLVMVYASIVLTCAGLLYFSRAHTVVSPYFLLFPLFTQIQMLRELNAEKGLATHGDWQTWAASGESEAWLNGKPGKFPPGVSVSPWFRAATLLRSGKPDQAGLLLANDFANPGQANWLPPKDASERELEQLVATLPQPLPTGNPYSEMVLANVLTRLGEYDRGAHYAAALYSRHPAAIPAATVAQCAAALGQHDLAINWLRTASSSADTTGLLQMLDKQEFFALRDRPEVWALRQSLMAKT